MPAFASKRTVRARQRQHISLPFIPIQKSKEEREYATTKIRDNQYFLTPGKGNEKEENWNEKENEEGQEGQLTCEPILWSTSVPFLDLLAMQSREWRDELS
jgi:hypothetical protein